MGRYVSENERGIYHLIFAILVALVVLALVSIYLAKIERKPVAIEITKLILSVSTVFLGVFSAQYYSNYYHSERETQHILKLLKVTHYELNSFNEYLREIPAQFTKARQSIKGYEPHQLFKDNPIDLPSIVNTTLSDTNIIRTMHPQSIGAINVSFENSSKALKMLKREELSERNLQELVDISLIHISELAKYVEYEIRFQKGEITQDELFTLHRAEIRHFENNPVKSLMKLN